MFYFHFGLIFFLFFRVSALLNWFILPFNWSEGVIQDERIGYRVKRNKKAKSIESVTISVDVPDKIKFRAHNENAFDKFAKKLGFAREFQAKDAQFDNAVYLVSDDDVLLNVLSKDTVFRTSLIEATYDCRYIDCSNGRIVVEMADRGFGYPTEDFDIAEKATRLVLPALKQIRERIHACQADIWSARRDPRALVQSIVFMIMVALGIGATIAYGWLHIGGNGDQLVYESILKHEVVASIVSVGVLALLLLVALRFCSRTHLVLLEMFLVGLPSALLISNTYFDWSNKAFDQSDPRVVYVTASDMAVERGRKGRRSYYLIINDWPDSRVSSRHRVSESIYRNVSLGDCVRVTWHRGYYGDPWITDLTPMQTACKDLQSEPVRSQTAS